MNILIIEDEPAAAEQLKGFVRKVKPECTILPVSTSIAESILLLSVITPDLIFVDIGLKDGSAFEIFKQVKVQSPVVFTTAFNQYITNAFDLSGIAYLLKPIKQELIEKAFQNHERTRDIFHRFGRRYPKDKLDELLTPTTQKSQFLIRHGQKFIPIKTTEINHFCFDKGLTHLVTIDKRKYSLPESLSDLETILNPADFFRVNRKFIASKNAILSLSHHAKGQVKVNINLLESERVIASRDQTLLLKIWLNS